MQRILMLKGLFTWEIPGVSLIAEMEIPEKNIVFTYHGEQLTGNSKITFTELKLPEIRGVRTGFTDVVEVGDKFYFLAAAENINSTYDDGEVLGSIIGCIDVKTMKVTFTKEISDRHKFEGLTLQHNRENELSFLLCEDNDSDKLQTGIYLLKLKTLVSQSFQIKEAIAERMFNQSGNMNPQIWKAPFVSIQLKYAMLDIPHKWDHLLVQCRRTRQGSVQAYNNYCSDTTSQLLWYYSGTTRGSIKAAELQQGVNS